MQCLCNHPVKLQAFIVHTFTGLTCVGRSALFVCQPGQLHFTTTSQQRSSNQKSRAVSGINDGSWLPFDRHGTTKNLSLSSPLRNPQNSQSEQPGQAYTRQTSKSCTFPGLSDRDPSANSRDMIRGRDRLSPRQCPPNLLNLPAKSALDSPRDFELMRTTTGQTRSRSARSDKGNSISGWIPFGDRSRSSSQMGISRVISSRTPPSDYEPRLDRRRSPAPNREPWQIQKDALKEKFSTEGWAPRKRLSPDALEGIRALHAQFPEKYTTPVLADQFEVSVESIRRILKSKWRPNDEETASRRARWDKRGERIWSKMVALGAKPPKKWREVRNHTVVRSGSLISYFGL